MRLNGCHNRAPFKETMIVQAGWHDYSWTTGERVAAWKQSPFRMSLTCNYTTTELGAIDEKCNGCKWKLTQGSLL